MTSPISRMPSIPTRSPAAAPVQAARPEPGDSVELSWGYTPSVAAMELAGPHTLRDVPGYVRDNLGAETVDWIGQGKPVVIAVGEGQKTLNQLQEAGWELESPVDKPVGFHQVRHARNPQGQDVLLVWRVNGQDRTEHLQSMLRLAGADGSQVATLGQTHSFKDDYLRTFKKLGPAPDLVVYGMSKTCAASVLSTHPLRNMSHLLSVFGRRGAPVVGDTEKTSDMSGLRMEVMKLKNGQSIWFLPPLYGDLSKDLLDALLEHGAKKINFVGTAGGVDPKLQVRQVTSPQQWVHDNGEREELTWLTPTRGQQGHVSYSRVTTPNLETQAWAQRMDARDVDVIEVELGYWLEATRHRPDVQLRVQTVVSDVIQGPNHRDMTEWGFKDTLATRHPVLTAIEEALGLPNSRQLVVDDYHAVPLVQPATP